MSKVIEITNINEYDAFKNNNKRGIIFYGAAWCAACKEIESLYARIANRYQKRIGMAHVDIDVCKLDFSKVPIFVSFYKGQQLNSMEGSDREGLKALVKEAIEHEYHSRNPEESKELIKHNSRIKKLDDADVIIKEMHDHEAKIMKTEPTRDSHTKKLHVIAETSIKHRDPIRDNQRFESQKPRSSKHSDARIIKHDKLHDSKSFGYIEAF